jgi:hypothetical protein
MQIQTAVKPKPVMFRPSPEMLQWLEAEAKKNLRSVSAQANWVLRQFREKQGGTQ